MSIEELKKECEWNINYLNKELSKNKEKSGTIYNYLIGQRNAYQDILKKCNWA